MCRGFLLWFSYLCVCYGSGCVSTCDTSIDYFPYKIDSTFARSFDLEYYNYYKILTLHGTDGNQAVVLYQCGCPNPNITTAKLSIEIPVTRVAFTDTPTITFIELLDMAYVSSACVQELFSESYIINAYNASTYSAIPEVITEAKVQVTFTNYLYGLPNEVGVYDYDETSSLSQAQYIEFFSVFYNKEALAIEIFRNITKTYNCTYELASLIASRSPLSTVLWCYWTGEFTGGNPSQWSCARCPNYYCEYMTALKADLLLYEDLNLPTNGPYDYLNDSAFIEMAVKAEVWIYTGTNFTGTYRHTHTLLDQIPAVQNQKVYSLDAAGIDYWFEAREPQPDAALEDCLSVLALPQYVNHNRVFFRNVYSEAVKSPTVCEDTSARLELTSTQCSVLDAEKLLLTSVSSGSQLVSTLLWVLLSSLMLLWHIM